MPLTPLHLGPGLLLGVFTLRFFNLWAILLGSVVMDVEPLALLIINPCYSCPHHGFFHSILGAIIGSLILAAILYKFREKLNHPAPWNIPFYLQKNVFGNKGRGKINQPFSFKVLFSSSLAAWLIHIFFDSLTHFDVLPFWPSHFNPIFIGKEVYWPLTFLFIIFGILGLILFYRKLRKQ